MRKITILIFFLKYIENNINAIKFYNYGQPHKSYTNNL